MSETRVHVVITDVRQGDRPQASSVVNVPAGAGQARFRAAALSEGCRFVSRPHVVRLCGLCGCRALTEWAKAKPGAQTRRSAFWGHRSRDGGTESSSGGVNWGTSGSPGADGINPKPAVAGRSSDVAIVSEEAGGQNNRRRSQGPLGGWVVSEAVRAAWTKVPLRNQTRPAETSTVSASKPPARRRRVRLTARLKPYWGKPTVRNFRGGGGNEVDGLMTVCHDARKGRHKGSHWPNHVAPPLYSTQCPFLPDWVGQSLVSITDLGPSTLVKKAILPKRTHRLNRL